MLEDRMMSVTSKKENTGSPKKPKQSKTILRAVAMPTLMNISELDILK